MWRSSRWWAGLCLGACLGTGVAQPAPTTPAAAPSSTAEAAGTPVTSPSAAVARFAIPGRPRVGLVLAGGGARGGAHLGVLKVLEELRVPIDVIVGTSAGSIVGAAYASGMPLEEIEAQMKGLDNATLFRDVDRVEEPYRNKADDATNLLGVEVGISPKGIGLPKGVVAGVSLEAVLRRLTARQTQSDFDRLPIPFRAVATDIANGEMVVLSEGSLATAVRASMAIPAAVNPVELHGRLLVDGGLVRNLPVDVARALGAEVIVAVNVGTPLRSRERIGSVLDIADQLTNILTSLNVNRSLAELTSNDVLITPDLSAVGTTEFDKLPIASQAGEEAARRVGPQLTALAVGPGVFADWSLERTRTSADPRQGRVVAEVRVTGTDRVNPEVIRAAITTQPGDVYDAARADTDLKRIYSRGDFEAVNYELLEVPGVGPVLETRVTEKSWGPQYLRFGLGLFTDFRGESDFQLRAMHRWTWLNPLGGEWRNDVLIGRVNGLRTEFYQPLSPRQRWFVAINAGGEDEPFDVYFDRQQLARFRLRQATYGLDLGVPISTVGELRLGALRGRIRFEDDISTLLIDDLFEADLGGGRLAVRLDTLDSMAFPRRGLAGGLEVYRSLPAAGATDAYTRVKLDGQGAITFGPHTWRVAVEAATSATDQPLPAYELFQLGGFLRLSGYRPDELLGRDLRFGRLVYARRLTAVGLLEGAYFGASAEAGRVDDFVSASSSSAGWRYSLGAHVGVDTPLGPVYLGYGRGDEGRHAVYLYLGQP